MIGFQSRPVLGDAQGERVPRMRRLKGELPAFTRTFANIRARAAAERGQASRKYEYVNKGTHPLTPNVRVERASRSVADAP